MITFFEELTEPLNDNEMSILPYVEKAFTKISGRKNIMKANDLCMLVNTFYQLESGNMDFPVNSAKLRKFINYLRSNGMLPVIGTKDGYFVSSEKEELEKQIKSLTERANGVLAAANGLKRFVC